MRASGFRAAAVLVLLASQAWPGKFNFGFMSTKSDDVTLAIPRPPDAYIAKKNASVQVVQAAAQFRDRDGLRMAIERALTPDFTLVAQPEVTFKVSVVTYAPPSSRVYSQTESRYMKVGQRPAYNKNGTPKVDSNGRQQYEDVFENRQVPVEYWEGRGDLSLRVEVWDSAGTLLDGFAPQQSYTQKIMTAVNRESQLGGKVLPDNEAILQSMVDALAGMVTVRYRKTSNVVKFKLACDDELRAGNATAISGNWQGALKQWTAVSMKKNAGDRVYNMAVAHEALAYETYNASQNPEESDPLFAKAIQLYAEAMRLDPEEKYIQQASKRLELAKANIENAKKQWAVQKFEADKALAELEARRQAEEAKRIEEEASSRELTAAREDTPQEASFRTIVRLRLKSGAAPVPDADKSKMEELGVQAYRLSALHAQRVVVQEAARREKLAGNVAMYRDTFSALASDKQISIEERKTLGELSRNLDLSPDDLKEAEAAFQFREAGAASPAPVAAAPAGPAKVQPRTLAPKLLAPAKPPAKK